MLTVLDLNFTIILDRLMNPYETLIFRGLERMG